MGTPELRIRLFGELDLQYNGERLASPESGRVASLLAYLLLHRRAPQSRQHLAFLLWPDSSEAQARTNLRHLLHILRRLLPDADQFLDVTSRTIQWRTDASFWLDVAAFEELVSAADEDGSVPDLAGLRAAAELYVGDLLEGLYDEWLLGEREQLRQRYLHLLERLARSLEARGDLASAIQYAEQFLRHEPLSEETYRLLMRLYDAYGERARALRVYHVCVTTLERELAVAPSARTQAAYEALLPLEQDDADDRDVERLGGAPLVGRVSERQQMTAIWRSATQGDAQFVLLTGEPGVGKTRLVDEVRQWCAHHGAAVAMARSYAAEGALAYAPVVSWLRSEALARRRHTLSHARRSTIARLLPELADEEPGLAVPEQLSESDARQRLFDALSEAIRVVSDPLLLVADDLHWADRETLQFLHYLLRQLPEARLLVLATARREEFDAVHPLNDLVLGLRALERFTEIEIGRLTEAETATLAEKVAGFRLAGPDASRLFRETEGNPLFVVEALRAGWTQGQDLPGWLTPRVQAVIQARLAQLSESARRLLGFCATIGREFTLDVLAAASGSGDEVFIGALDELWRRGIVREQGADGYDFTHDKIREVAYHGLSPAVRRYHHLAVAQALERLNSHDAGPVSSQLAVQYESAGAITLAIDWYERAAEAAQQLNAPAETARLLRRAIDLVHGLPETPDRQQRELALLTALLGPLVELEGFRSPYLAELHERSMTLAGTLGVEPATLLLSSLATASIASGSFDAAERYGKLLRARGERDGDDVLIVQSDYLLGITAFWNSRFDVACLHLKSAIERCRPENRRAHLLRFGMDPLGACELRLAFALWFLGRPAEACRIRDEALARDADTEHWWSRLGVLHFAGLLSLETGEHEVIRRCLSVVESLREQHEAAYIEHIADALVGYVEVLDGHSDTGIERIERTLADLLTGPHMPGQRSFVARVLLAARSVVGDPRAGLAAADRLLAPGDGVSIWNAEAHRMRAEFLAVLGASDDAVEAELDLALQIARRQQARTLELRAATSLLRYRLTHGDAAASSEACATLADLVAAISDGAGTADLREAEALLSAS